MEKRTKAVLYSALICPGIGHFVYRKWWRGLLFIVPVALAMTYYIRQALDMAMRLFDKILNGKIEPDKASLLAAIREQMTPEDSVLMNACLAVVMLCWALALVDLYIINRQTGPGNTG